MGFGILIFGYALLFGVPFHGIDIPPSVLGYALIFLALHKLGEYDKRLKIAKWFAALLTLLGLGRLALQLAGALGHSMELPLTVLQIADAAVLVPFYVFTLLGIASLAASVDLPGLGFRAKRNLVFVAVFYLFSAYTNLYVSELLPTIRGLEPAAVFALQQLAGYLIRFLNLILFVSCYMRICLEGDEDMPYTLGPLERKLQQMRGGGKRL